MCMVTNWLCERACLSDKFAQTEFNVDKNAVITAIIFIHFKLPTLN